MISQGFAIIAVSNTYDIETLIAACIPRPARSALERHSEEGRYCPREHEAAHSLVHYDPSLLHEEAGHEPDDGDLGEEEGEDVEERGGV